MKFCTKCGAEMLDESVICIKCGCAATNNVTPQNEINECPKKTGFSTAAKVFMIIGTVMMALMTLGIALAWCLPLTIIYFNNVNKGKHIGVGFKICSLLFVSMLGGIFMLCEKN